VVIKRIVFAGPFHTTRLITLLRCSTAVATCYLVSQHHANVHLFTDAANHWFWIAMTPPPDAFDVVAGARDQSSFWTRAGARYDAVWPDRMAPVLRSTVPIDWTHRP